MTNGKAIIKYSQCPSCANEHISPVLNAKDHTVSNDEFEVWQCADCSLRFTQNIPPLSDIGRYYQSEDYISHSDTKDGIINKLYHFVRAFSLRQKRALVRKVCSLEKGKILDVGSGTGAFANEMKTAGWDVTGLEPDAKAGEVAKSKYGIDLLPIDSIYGLPTASFDAITLWHVLEHVHDLHGYFKAFHASLKPSGKLVIAVPNYTSFDAKIYQHHWAAYDVPRHLYHFSPTSMVFLALAKSFEVVAYKPMVFDSFYVSLLSSQYRSGSTKFLEAFFTGLLSNLKSVHNPRLSSSVIYVLTKRASVLED